MQWLFNARKAKGLSQREVSNRVGIKQPSYCAIETGASKPKPETAKRIASVLDFDWTLFYQDDAKSEVTTP